MIIIHPLSVKDIARVRSHVRSAKAFVRLDFAFARWMGTELRRLLGITIVCFCLVGCSYRLTNLHIYNPESIQTIAIESVFDTGGQVVPHEQLWDQLQRAFAANGHLKLTSVDKADALLRAHLRIATVSTAGTLHDRGIDPRKDPEIFDGRPDPPPLGGKGALRDLTRATRVYDKDALTFVVDVEIWNLQSRELMLQRTYSGRTDVWSIIPGVDPRMALVRHDEAQDRHLSTVARQIAETVVSDLLVR